MGDADRADELVVEAKRRDGIEKKALQRVFDQFLYAASHYGYDPIRTFVISVVVLVVFILMSVGLGMWDEVVLMKPDGTDIVQCRVPATMTRRVPGDYALGSSDTEKQESSTKEMTPTYRAGSYPGFHILLYHLDTFVPLLDLEMRSHWIANTGVEWDLAKRAYVLPARQFPESCVRWLVNSTRSSDLPDPGTSVPNIRSRPSWSAVPTGTIEWVNDTSDAPRTTIPVGTLLFYLLTLERILGAVFTALLIVGMTGTLKKIDD